MTGIDRPSVGHSLPVLRSLNARFMGWFLGTNLSKQIVVFLYLVDYNFVFFYDASWWFNDTSIEFIDTSMILLCKYIWKYHFVIPYVSVIYLKIMILWYFFKKKHLCASGKGMGESASFVCGSACHFPVKCRKIENNLQKACQSHFFFLFLYP